VLAVGECLAVVAERCMVGGEGVVDAEPVIVGAGRQGGELGVQHDVLQPGIGARPPHTYRTARAASSRWLSPEFSSGASSRPVKAGVPRAAGVEGQQ
jgi:hypothetical protein